MTHKAWSSIEEVPYCFSRSSIKFQGHTGQKITDFDLNWTFPDCNPSLNSKMALKWRTMLDVVGKSSPIVYQGHPSNFEVTRPKFRRFLNELSVSGPSLQFEFFKMMLKDCRRIGKVSYWFSRSSAKFQGHTEQITNFDPNWAFPYCNSSLNSLMAVKWCTVLNVV